MARLSVLLLCLLPLLRSSAVLYTPNKAGVQLNAPPGLDDSVPGPAAEKSSREAPYSGNEGPATKNVYGPRTERPLSSPPRGQRPPELTPYVGEGYVDANSQKGPRSSESHNSGGTPAYTNANSHHGNLPGAAGPVTAIGSQKHPQYDIQPSQSQPQRYESPSQGQQSPSLPVFSPLSSSGPGSSGQGYQPPKDQSYSPVGDQVYPSSQPSYASNNEQLPYSQYTAPASNSRNNQPAQPQQQYDNQSGSPQSQVQSQFAAGGANSDDQQFPSKPQKPDFPATFSFPDGLNFGQNAPFGNLVSFNSPRPFKSRAPTDFPSKDSILSDFPAPANNYASESRPTPASRPQPAPVSQQNYPVSQQNYPVSQQNYPSAYGSHTNRVPQQPTFYQPPGNSDPRYAGYSDPRYAGIGSNSDGYYGYNRAPVGGGQCFQYTYAAEAYRLSDIAKNYPQDAIQKELDEKPYLAPLVGLEASAKSDSGFNAFSFNRPIDFGFGFQNNESPAEKYGYLLNAKAYPGNFKEGDFNGGYPATMRPLDTSCPSQEYKLRSFFYHGGDCHVVNPEFQLITYHRCSRRECNFCGVNRGLSACVEDYRWFTVFAYCSKLKEGSRITPLRLVLPVGCTCQHFPC